MSTPLILGCGWVLAAAICAMLPMRRQCAPGIVLLALAPVTIGWIWASHGWVAGAAALAAAGSIFRNPLIHVWRRARGERPEVPE